MVGHLVALYLEERGYDVVGASRRRAPVRNWVYCDVNDADALARLLAQGEFDIVVNAAGLLVAECEAHPDRAVYVNAYVPRLLSELTKEHGGRVVQLSTDCIFAGNTGPYTEASVPDGTKLYARTKFLGELDDGRNLTLRNSVIGPDIHEDGIGLLNWFMKQEKEVDGWTRAIWTGLTTLELAKVIEKASQEGATGLVNMVPDCPPICKHDLLGLFNDYLRGGSVEVSASDWFVSDKALTRTNYDFAYDIPCYEDMVREMASWIRNHEDLYPGYYQQRGL